MISSSDDRFEPATDLLKLDRQLCFALYTLSKEITNRYRPLLEPLDLTYPQYLVMLVLWEQDGISVKELGDRLHLDSGTLTPLLKRLAQKGILTRSRDGQDERKVCIALTESGQAMRMQAQHIAQSMAQSLEASSEETAVLHKLINRLCSSNQ